MLHRKYIEIVVLLCHDYYRGYAVRRRLFNDPEMHDLE